MIALDLSSAFEDDSPQQENITSFDATSTTFKYVFGPDVKLNYSQLNIKPEISG